MTQREASMGVSVRFRRKMQILDKRCLRKPINKGFLGLRDLDENVKSKRGIKLQQYL